MTTQSPINPWEDEANARFLRLRMKTFWNIDYFEKIVLPLLDLPEDGQVLDVGCGNGGISFLLSELRRDLSITGIDYEIRSVEGGCLLCTDKMGRGDDTLGVRVPLLATQAGLDVFDVRLNDRAMHVFPPYRYEKQRNYLELAKAANAPDTDDRWLRLTIERIVAGGGMEEEGRWYYEAIDSEAILPAISQGSFTETGSFPLYLTFARKP